MPYHEDGSDVPARIKGKKKRRQFAHVWNSEYQAHHDEGRAFAAANSVYSSKKALEAVENALNKFGTSLVGYTSGEFGPFKCSNCEFSEGMDDESICTNPEVAEDTSVPTDSYGNKLIDPDGCCNEFTPIGEEK